MMKLFVYGTLRKGARAYDEYLGKYVLKRYPAFVKGELYQVKNGNYPALLQGSRFILGDVFELAQEFDFKQLDSYEGYYGENNPNNLYHRVVMDVYDENKQWFGKAYCYLYNVDEEEAFLQLDYLIESDDFLNQ